MSMMLILLLSILTISVIGILVCSYMLFRNEWVCKQRVKLVWNDYEKYNKLSSYRNMLFRHPFTWNINKFIKD